MVNIHSYHVPWARTHAHVPSIFQKMKKQVVVEVRAMIIDNDIAREATFANRFDVGGAVKAFR